MKKENETLSLKNRELAKKFIELDIAYEKQSGESLLKDTRQFLESLIQDTDDLPMQEQNFNLLLDKRLTNKKKV